MYVGVENKQPTSNEEPGARFSKAQTKQFIVNNDEQPRLVEKRRSLPYQTVKLSRMQVCIYMDK